jgi:hypothetical protein
LSTRQIASPKQRRGAITTDEDIRRVFQHLVKDPKTGYWKLKPFKNIIRGDKHQSSLPHNVEVQISNGMQYADYLDIAKNTFLGILRDFPDGVSKGSKTLAGSKVEEYEKTLCYQKLKEKYFNPIKGEWTQQGSNVNSMGRNAYMMLGQKDPAMFTLDEFRQVRNDPRFCDVQGKIKFAPLSQIRCIMQFAALKVEDSPLSERRFTFSDGDEWDTTGKKNIGSKKDDYLQESELKAFVENINEIDTLVLHRLGVEGGGRISSQLLMGTTLPNGYRCQAVWSQNKITMFEPKVEGSKTGGRVARYFTPLTMAFFKRYVDDFNLMGSWFQRFPSEDGNYQSFSASIKAAGFRAGIWRFKRAKQGEQLQQGEKLSQENGRVYRLKPVNDTKKGTVAYRKQWLTEGKMTTSHTVMKHTFVSLAGLHGLSLDDCAEQCGTDPTTIKDFYHGTLGDKLRNAILGEQTFEPWQKWIERFVNPLYTKRYNELMNKGKTAFDVKAAVQETKVLADVGDA